jgi:hypothetical protein
MTSPLRWPGCCKGFLPRESTLSAKGMAGIRMSKSPASRIESSIMDVEHINAIGNSLADLTKRTVDLRGYL